MSKSNSIEKKKELAEQMLNIFYDSDNSPSSEFLSDLDLMVNGKISAEDIRTRIIARNKA